MVYPFCKEFYVVHSSFPNITDCSSEFTYSSLSFFNTVILNSLSARSLFYGLSWLLNYCYHLEMAYFLGILSVNFCVVAAFIYAVYFLF